MIQKFSGYSIVAYTAELESRPKSSRPRRDIDVKRPRLWAKSRDETETLTCRDRDETDFCSSSIISSLKYSLCLY